jgi:metal-sulfur cluster biosynthetic enzyme
MTDYTATQFAAPPRLDNTPDAEPDAPATDVPASDASASDASPAPQASPALPSKADVEEALRDVIDPELGINVVDLGLLYGVNIDPQGNAVVDMTLTSVACPLTDMIEAQASAALEGMVNSVAVNWVWNPPWGPDRITPDGREQLRALGFNV